MPTPSLTAPTRTPDHAARAGWALSGITCVVLAIGILVINSTRRDAPDPAPTSPSGEVSVATPRPAEPGPERSEWITLQGSSTSPRPLPTPAIDDEAAAPLPGDRPTTADRTAPRGLDRR